VLIRDTKAAGKPENAFETPEQQIRFFADLPAKTEADFLASTLDDVDDGVGKIDKMVAAWAAGDTAELETGVRVGDEGRISRALRPADRQAEPGLGGAS
jgi:uncharacterized protein YbaP (TraB family)